MQSLEWGANQPTTLSRAAEQFRDQIWVMVENWMQCLISEEGENIWERISEIQLVDNLPTLLGGIAKVIENPKRTSDFEPDGIIYQAATELGRNRQKREYKPSEVLHEQKVLRGVIWQFCRENFTSLDFYELEQRINRPLDMMVSTITENYISSHTSELKQRARRDKLTGLLNYESFKEMLGDELKRSSRYRRAFSLIMVDIDEFKDYNEDFGQPAGDILIQEVARIIAHSVRGVDMLAKYGEDEFAIILPETGKKQAHRVAERIRRAIKLETRHSAQVKGDMKLPVTVSIGISTYPKDAEAADDIISLADEALYEAKRAGKDIVTEATSNKKR
ncbi:MAG: GGDEF domain-containing protein [Actinobacteria bacterium]|nr:GGDEF domain-containing protein [Actinomycetota bacterium]